jgi:hypothetical protein
MATDSDGNIEGSIINRAQTKSAATGVNAGSIDGRKASPNPGIGFPE